MSPFSHTTPDLLVLALREGEEVLVFCPRMDPHDGSVLHLDLTVSMLDVPPLETWLWDARYQIHGPFDALKFKDYTLPLIS